MMAETNALETRVEYITLYRTLSLLLPPRGICQIRNLRHRCIGNIVVEVPAHD
jgi:hypothetical protein